MQIDPPGGTDRSNRVLEIDDIRLRLSNHLGDACLERFIRSDAAVDVVGCDP